MNPLIDFLSEGSSTFLWVLLVDSGLKSVVVLGVAALACLAMRRASAAARHLVWSVGVVSVLLLPVLATVLPSWRVPVLPQWRGQERGSEVTPLYRTAALSRVTARPDARELWEASPASEPTPSLGAAASESKEGRRTAKPSGLGTHWRLSGVDWAIFGWGIMAVVALAPVVAGAGALTRLLRRARRMEGEDWSALLGRLQVELGLGRPVRLFEGDGTSMPMTWGHWRPVVLLPADARAWPGDRRRMVLLHELAHIKRWDCLTQMVARLACGLFWFNPLVWVAAWRMRVERERACDDLVLGGGSKASDYADHLLNTAMNLRGHRLAGALAIAMARPSTLEGRLVAILDGKRSRRAVTRWTFLVAFSALACVAVPVAMMKAAAQPEAAGGAASANQSISVEDGKKRPVARLAQVSIPPFPPRVMQFAVEMEQEARGFAAEQGKTLPVVFNDYFAAAKQGDWASCTNLYAEVRRQCGTNQGFQALAFKSVTETYGVMEQFAECDPKHGETFARDIINSIPAGSVYFGGNAAGRYLVTAFSQSRGAGDPFFTVPQNVLADEANLAYLRHLYGQKIQMLTDEDYHKAYADYTADAQERMKRGQLKPGEDVREVGGRIQVNSHIGIMQINALLAKRLFDTNPKRDFYLVESFPLDWMYPHLTPHQLIMKVNRQPVAELAEEVVKADRDYWRRYLARLLGDWLTTNTPVSAVCEFVEKVHVRRELRNFEGDSSFVDNEASCRMYSKLRGSIGGLYAWRADNAKSAGEHQRMNTEADFAFRQAFALCPSSPEVLYRYINLLVHSGRVLEAIPLVEVSKKMDPNNKQFDMLLRELNRVRD
jgi:beta-lactamase regulating signal transducer with metallopeptidase domain